MHSFKVFLVRSSAFAALWLIAACNSSSETVSTQSIPVPTTITSGGTTTITSGTSSSTTTAPEPNYETLQSTRAGVTILAGVSVTANGTGVVPVNSSTGSIDRTTSAIIIDDGKYRLVDTDGFAIGQATDGTAVLKLASTGKVHQYMQAYNMSYRAGGMDHEVIGVYGNPTRAEDLPSAGKATYSGESDLGYSNRTGVPFVQTASGSATIRADFAAGTVDVESRYVFFKDNNGNTVFNPTFNKIERTGMQINGGAFSGGTAVFTKNGVVVDPVGANATNEARGQFYGGERSGTSTRPAEVAGMSAVIGDDGLVTNSFFGN